MDSTTPPESTQMVALGLTRLIVEQEGKTPGSPPIDRREIFRIYRLCHRLAGRVGK